jgi:hypothetical protein
LLRLWIYSLPTNPKCKPPLCLAGLVGSGKTKTANGVAELYGLPFNAQQTEEAGEDDFWPAMDAGGIVCMDNADTRKRWLPDALACAATGGSQQRRRLYTNGELVTLRSRAWVIITTSNPTFASDAGLADRLLPVRMEPVEADTSDSALLDEIAANRDAALRHIAETIAHALKDTQTAPNGLNRRHPDFAAFAVKLGRALQREQETINALKATERDKSDFLLENDPTGSALVNYLRVVGTFRGTAAQLVPHLIEIDPDLDGRVSARGLGKHLCNIWPHVQKALQADKQSGRGGFTIFSFKTLAGDFGEFQTAVP